MKNTLSILAAFAAVSSASAQLLITGIGDGPLSGGIPKFIEIYVASDVADLSTWKVQNFNNGDVAPVTSTLLSGSATAGSFIYVASETTGFTSFFGFAPDFFGGALNINGDDAVLLLNNDVGVDVFGVIGVDGTGESWGYLDGWAYRMDETGPGTTFVSGEWTYSGVDGFEGGSTNATVTNPFPTGTYAVPEPSTYAALLGLAALGFMYFRRRNK